MQPQWSHQGNTIKENRPDAATNKQDRSHPYPGDRDQHTYILGFKHVHCGAMAWNVKFKALRPPEDDQRKIRRNNPEMDENVQRAPETNVQRLQVTPTLTLRNYQYINEMYGLSGYANRFLSFIVAQNLNYNDIIQNRCNQSGEEPRGREDDVTQLCNDNGNTSHTSNIVNLGSPTWRRI